MQSEKANVLISGPQSSENNLSETNSASLLSENTETRHSTWAGCTRWFQSWHGAIRAGTLIGVLNFVANLCLLIAARVEDKRLNHAGVLQVFDPDCSASTPSFMWWHFATNVISTVLLATSGVCIQVLGAPSRSDVDDAHRRSSWVHVGVVSPSAITYIPGKRLAIIVVLALSFVPMHFFYNSAIYASHYYIQYTSYGVFRNFLDGGPHGTFVRPSSEQNNYTANNTEASIDLSIKQESELLVDLQRGATDGRVLQPCNLEGLYQSSSQNRSPQVAFDAVLLISNVTNQTDSIFAYAPILHKYGEKYIAYPYWEDLAESTPPIEIGECLGRPAAERCGVFLGEINMAVVLVCNFLQLVCMIFCLMIKNHAPLLTAGDTITSFLMFEDGFTKGSPPISMHAVNSRQSRRINRWFERMRKPAWYRKMKGWLSLRWGAVPMVYLYAVPYIIWYPVTKILLIRLLDPNLPFGNYLKDMHEPFGALNPPMQSSPMFEPGPTEDGYSSLTPSSITIMSMKANWPHLILPIMYLCYNGATTSMFFAAEYSSFAAKRQPLTVSAPTQEGAQRSSFRLNIPLWYTLPNMLAWAVLHFLTSQMILIQVKRTHTPFATPERDKVTASIVLSRHAAWGFIAVGNAIITFTKAVGFCKLTPGIPVAGTCSKAIASACHPGEGEPADAAGRPVMFGRVRNGEGTGAMAFSSRAVERLET